MRIDEVLVMLIILLNAAMLVWIVISLLYQFFTGVNSDDNEDSSKSLTFFIDYGKAVSNLKELQRETQKKVTKSPKTINSQPELLVSLIGGEFRTFQNYYINGIQYTFGFPNDNCKDKRIWVGIGKEEVERITFEEAMKRIHNKSIDSRMAKQIDNRSEEGNTLPF